MSSSYVRTIVRQWLNDPSVTTPYYDTVNLEQNPSDTIWMTASFDSLYRETLTFCEGEVREDGEVTLVWMGQPGIGDTALIAAAEKDIQILMAMRDPANKFIITGRTPPDEYSGGDANMSYQVAIFLDYSYYEG